MAEEISPGGDGPLNDRQRCAVRNEEEDEKEGVKEDEKEENEVQGSKEREYLFVGS
jgi:hypothetical protein